MMNPTLKEWLEGKPDKIKELAFIIPPYNKYRIKKTGQHGFLYSYSENGTVTMVIDGHDSETLNATYNMIPIKVFGIIPEDVEPI